MFIIVLRLVVQLELVFVPASKMRAILLLRTELGQQIPENDLDVDRVIRVALVEIGVVERMVPLRAEHATDRFKDSGLRRIALSDQAERLLVREIPFEFANSSEVQDLQLSDLHCLPPYSRRSDNHQLIRQRFLRHFMATSMENDDFGSVHEQQTLYG